MAILLAGFNAVSQLAGRQAGTPRLSYEVNVSIAGMAGSAHGLDGSCAGVRRISTPPRSGPRSADILERATHNQL